MGLNNRDEAPIPLSTAVAGGDEVAVNDGDDANDDDHIGGGNDRSIPPTDQVVGGDGPVASDENDDDYDTASNKTLNGSMSSMSSVAESGYGKND